MSSARRNGTYLSTPEGERERPSFYAGMGKRDNKVGGGDGVCHMRPQLDLCSTCANTEIKDNAVRLSASCGSFGIIIQI